jgi:hypothetical protein
MKLKTTFIWHRHKFYTPWDRIWKEKDDENDGNSLSQ